MTGKNLINALPNMPGMLTPPLAGSGRALEPQNLYSSQWWLVPGKVQEVMMVVVVVVVESAAT